MPLAAGDFSVDAVYLLPAAFDDAVESDIVFERVGTHNVIVVAIKNTNSDTPCLINVAGDGFEFQGDIDVLGGDGIKNCERETIIGSVRARLFNGAACKGCFIVDHDPSAKIT